ncbi:hypothetical protein ILYODFUR_035579 [Ilyodon furcidens]|uniref:Uncharacterized protein n=1 Tax=Ilyodon furcidens TaxID=33524 RepID=A0ABV0TRA5_9TELE
MCKGASQYIRILSIHPFAIPASSIVGRGEAGAYLQRSMGERRGTPWTGRQSIAGQHRDTHDKQPFTHPFTPKGNLERPMNLTVMVLGCGRSWSTRREPTHARGEHANSMQKDPRLGVKPRTYLLLGNSATNCTTISILLKCSFVSLTQFA